MPLIRAVAPFAVALALVACGPRRPDPAPTPDGNAAAAEQAADKRQVNQMVADTRLETLEARVSTLENQVDTLQAQASTRADIGTALATAPAPPAAAPLPPPRLPYVAPAGPGRE